MDKRKISGIKETKGKFSLKAIGNNIMEMGKNAVNNIKSAVENPKKAGSAILLGSLLLASSVTIPEVGIGIGVGVMKDIGIRSIRELTTKPISVEIEKELESGEKLTSAIRQEIEKQIKMTDNIKTNEIEQTEIKQEKVAQEMEEER